MAESRNWLAIPVGVAVALAGGAFAVSDVYYASAAGTTLPVDTASVLLFCCALWTALTGGWLLVSRPANEHVLRLLAWWGGGMVVTLLMVATLLQHQSERGVRIAAPYSVAVNSVTVGSAGGLLIAYFYTKARRTAAALASQHEQLQREQERLAVLNRMVSHDIRNDMSVVLGWSDVLRENATPEGREIVDQIHAASEHVVELTDLSRDYVSVVVDEDSMETGPVDLAETLDAEINTRRDVYPAATFTVHGDAPAVRVTANELLSSVFRNVLNNAVQHNDAAAPRVDVSVTLRDDAVRVAIADDGPGVSDDRKRAVFGKDESGLESEGTGMGLYLVRVLVEEFGGAVWIEDNDPTGTVVVVELRRTSGERDRSVPSPRSPTGVA